MPLRILLVDDQRGARRLVRQALAPMGDVDIVEAVSADQAVAAVESAPPDLILLDVRLTDDEDDRGGLEVLRSVRQSHPALPVVMVTASSEIASIREAMRLGAQDYVLKDELSPELLVPIVEGLRERAALRGEVVRLRERIQRTWGMRAIVGASPAIERVRQLVQRVADADATILLLGDTGSGKETVARALHETGGRRDQPFIGVNCTTLPSLLMESLLFGHERGAFTGATVRSKGHFELAGKGTLLLDEIGDMPPELQAKLLRVLEERRFRPLGATHEVPLFARVLAATNADLAKRVAEGRFREDLYYRLDVVSIRVPPLSERVEDIPLLIEAFLAETPRRLRLTQGAMAWLARRAWPGNVRELRNMVERIALLAEEDVVDEASLERLAPEHSPSQLGVELDRIARLLLALPAGVGNKMEAVERSVIELAARSCDGNRSAAARLVGMDRKAFDRRWGKRAADDPDP